MNQKEKVRLVYYVLLTNLNIDKNVDKERFKQTVSDKYEIYLEE